ncbi:hypothetical protein HDV00_010846 [Rhizophlyctis rosea]|nr:hypothetical protein HDV00_010846 [Rhizophlyctis rosea]
MAKDDFLAPYRQIALHFENQPIQTDEIKRKARMLRKLSKSLEDGNYRDRIVADSIMKFHEIRPEFENALNTQNIMVFEDGVFSFDSMTFGPGSPETLMKFLDDVLPNVEVREYTLKVFGVCLTLEVLQYFFLWTGSWGNGKGRLVRLMEECLGPYYQAVSPTMLTRRREDANQANEALMSLVTARLAVFQEAEATDRLQAGTVKSITGNDTQTSRQNCGRQQKFRAFFKSLIVCDQIPEFTESTLALWRRVKVTDFVTQFVDIPKMSNERRIDYDLD